MTHQEDEAGVSGQADTGDVGKAGGASGRDGTGEAGGARSADNAGDVGGPGGAGGPKVQFSYAVLRVVPHPHTGEGVPVGVVLHSRPAEYIGMRAITDEPRLAALVPDADIEMLARYLRSCQSVAEGNETAGDIALFPSPERFHWLTAPRSDVIQPSKVQHGTTEDPAKELQTLYQEKVEEPNPEG